MSDAYFDIDVIVEKEKILPLGSKLIYLFITKGKIQIPLHCAVLNS